MTDYSKLKQELHRQEHTNIFNAHNRLKHVCKECGHVEVWSKPIAAIRGVAIVVVTVLTMLGGLAFWGFVATYDSYKPILGYDMMTAIEQTKMEQMHTMSKDYAIRDNGKMGRYIVDTLIEARMHRINRTAYIYHNLTELGTIKALHKAVYEDIIYVPDPPYEDVLYSPLITLSHGGDCDDRTVLFLTLAEMAELDCFPAFTTRHTFAYCIYGEYHNRIVFVDVGVPELGLEVGMVGDYVELYKPDEIVYDEDFEVN